MNISLDLGELQLNKRFFIGKVLPALDGSRLGSVIDIGCGSGIYVELCRQIQEAVHPGVPMRCYHGIDQQELRPLEERYPFFRGHQLQLCRDPLPELPEVETVLCCEVIYYLPCWEQVVDYMLQHATVQVAFDLMYFLDHRREPVVAPLTYCKGSEHLTYLIRSLGEFERAIDRLLTKHPAARVAHRAEWPISPVAMQNWTGIADLQVTNGWLVIRKD